MASRLPTPFSSSRDLRRFDPLTELHREMNRLFDTVFSGGPAGALMGSPVGSGQNYMQPPRLDVREDERELCICVDVPGVQATDVDVRLDGDLLTISGEKKNEVNQQQGGYHLMERGYGRFQRSVQLPFAPDPEQVQAECENGVLTIHLPKEGQVERSRRIEVKSTGGGARQIGAGSGEATDATMASGSQGSGEGGKDPQNVHH